MLMIPNPIHLDPPRKRDRPWTPPCGRAKIHSTINYYTTNRIIQSTPMTESLTLPDAILDRVAEKFRMLGDPTRLSILGRALMAGEKSVGTVVTITGQNQANVSKHLKMLAEAGMASPAEGRAASVLLGGRPADRAALLPRVRLGGRRGPGRGRAEPAARGDVGETRRVREGWWLGSVEKLLEGSAQRTLQI